MSALFAPSALHIALPALELADSIAFYETLGFETLERGDDLAQMRLGPHRLSLKLTGEGSPSLQSDGRDGLRSRHVGVRVERLDEVDRAAAWARDNGLLVVEPVDRDDGRWMVCVDPSGNQVEVYYTKGEA